jgi:hypothetical protein
MAESLSTAIIPYALFLEYQARRRKTIAELIEPDHPSQTIDAVAVSAPVVASHPGASKGQPR